MRKLLILFCMIFNFNALHTQPAGIYTLRIPPTDTESNLYLFKSGTYYLELMEILSDDLVESFILSYGNYAVNGNSVSLHDKVNGFTMELKSEGQSLEVIKSFTCLMNLKFFYYDEITTGEPGFINSGTSKEKLREERQNYQLINKTPFPFDQGSYETPGDYVLNISEDFKFSLFYKDLLISNGTWTRNGNELSIFEADLKHHFYALIGNNVLTSKLLPGDYTGYILKKKSKEKGSLGCKRTVN